MRNGAVMKRRAPIVVLTLAIALAAAPRAQQKRFITEHDLLRFTWVADPQISPDGSTVAFVRVTVNEKENRYETSLFTVPASGVETPRPSTSPGRSEFAEGRRLTSGIRDTSP